MLIMHGVHSPIEETSFQTLHLFDNSIAARRISTLRRRSLQRESPLQLRSLATAAFFLTTRPAQRAMMTGKTITRADLTQAVYEKVGLSQAESARLVEQVLQEVSVTLVAGESVKLSGFGIFSVRQKGRRMGRNPKTNVEVPIEPSRSLTFSSSPLLRTRVNGGTPEPHSRRKRKEPHGPAGSRME